ncbi:hypothetical protein QR685DRAFT_291823 [Neurospora intermedia]|uniref:Secreted protein n=1 Tax=Neurospora intermedia TaxID=5142 RepID=A0ABR3DA33_NEUIN
MKACFSLFPFYLFCLHFLLPAFRPISSAPHPPSRARLCCPNRDKKQCSLVVFGLRAFFSSQNLWDWPALQWQWLSATLSKALSETHLGAESTVLYHSIRVCLLMASSSVHFIVHISYAGSPPSSHHPILISSFVSIDTRHSIYRTTPWGTTVIGPVLPSL